jgi:glucose-6-phosphate isomerase
MAQFDELFGDDAIREALAELDDEGALYRLFDKDPLLFDDDPDGQAEAAQRMGWLDVTERAGQEAPLLDAFVEEVRSDGLDRVVLAGMGGSSLAPEVFARVGGGSGGMSLDVLDSTHPDAVRAALDRDLSTTLVVVSSKSGTTEETRSFGAVAAERLKDFSRLAAITDPDSELAIAASSMDYRAVLLADPAIGGRYSALSLFGMVPAALLGYRTGELWARADRQLSIEGPGGDFPAGAGRKEGVSPATALAAFLGGSARSGRDKLTLLAAPGLESFGDWAEQLVAESLGKRGRGIVPVVGEPVNPSAYGNDRAFVELRLAGARAAGAQEVEAAGHAVLSLELADPYDLGAQFVLWELAVALTGVLLDVNPFDQPNVAESKANTNAVLDRLANTGELPAPEDGDIAALLGSVQPGDYVSLQAYLPPTPEVHATLRELQGRIRDRLSVAVTAGIGPRFLHSTGQLHKGGPNTIVALQIVDAGLWDERGDGIDIPGRSYDFRTLVRAQAAGDLQALRDHDRRVAQVGVAGAAGLRDLVARIDAALS